MVSHKCSPCWPKRKRKATRWRPATSSKRCLQICVRSVCDGSSIWFKSITRPDDLPTSLLAAMGKVLKCFPLASSRWRWTTLAEEHSHFLGKKKKQWDWRVPTVIAPFIPDISTELNPFIECIINYNPSSNKWTNSWPWPWNCTGESAQKWTDRRNFNKKQSPEMKKVMRSDAPWNIDLHSAQKWLKWSEYGNTWSIWVPLWNFQIWKKRFGLIMWSS